MIFSELYSAYYNTVAEIISRLIEGERDEGELQKIVSRKAFCDSTLTVLPRLKAERWQLMHPDKTTPIEHIPSMPLTDIERRWLKAVSLDKRVRLFGVEFPNLEGVEPLFTSDDYLVYDKYSDGDPYDDEGYVERFRFLLFAIKEKKAINVSILTGAEKEAHTRCIPIGLEYSEKDDKFRLITSGCHFMPVINLSKIRACSEYCGEHTIRDVSIEKKYETVTLEVFDERNALERVMLHFAHFEKRAEKSDSGSYTVKIKYDRNDEREILIRVLSFGPLVKVIEPVRFVDLIRSKLLSQRKCNIK